MDTLGRAIAALLLMAAHFIAIVLPVGLLAGPLHALEPEYWILIGIVSLAATAGHYLLCPDQGFERA